ncbi:glycosyltransferase family 4 protein [Guptibacillus spartinae]|uniref:glycosyltransferase family 4 protein n=1 Tax=Guptibacillus spartinae TaxID=3025679 RepID=UPI0023610426|nr:glycosyltransferase [Pseudalkalibacillus spartinae]
MKILFVYYLPSGGVETLNRQRCVALKEAGISCELLYMHSGAGFSNITDIPVYVTNDNEEIKLLLDRKAYSAVMVCSDHLFLKRIRELGYSGPLLYELQGLGTEQEAKNWMNEAKPYVHTYADAVFYPKTSHLEKLCQVFLPDFRSFSFHNCFDTDHFQYVSSNNKMEDPIIGWVGRLEPNKNWHGFLQLINELKRKHANIRVWMFQDPTLASTKEKAKFQQYIQKEDLEKIITTHSNIPHQNMALYYSMIADSGGFLCSTSQVEGFGYAVVEAMSCLCPVVSTDSDGIRSFLIHNETGKLIDLLHLQTATEECLELINNRKKRDRFVQQAKERIKINLNPKEYSRNFIKMLEELSIRP